jgi:chromatin remodeling complex protein RSC6
MPKGSGLTKPLTLSAELGEIVGAKKGEKLSRPEIVKRLWAYIKEHKLQASRRPGFFFQTSVFFSESQNLSFG